MANQPSPSGDMDEVAYPATDLETGAELLCNLLDTRAYPWLAAEVTDEYAQQLAAAGADLELSDEEAIEGWQVLSAQLESIWQEAANERSLAAQLSQRFGERLPADLIAHIAQKAQQLVQTKPSGSQAMLTQMVACVQGVLSAVATEDLQVMARPMAMAMRGRHPDDFIEATVRSVRSADWQALSAIEQARLSLAAARCAIALQEAIITDRP